MEKKHSTWFSHEAWTGVWTMMQFGWALASRFAAAWLRWSEPLPAIQNTRLAEA